MEIHSFILAKSVELKSDVSSISGVTPLHIAVVNQNINLVQHLISHGGDVAAPRVTGLYFRKRIGGLIYYGSDLNQCLESGVYSLKSRNIWFSKFPGEHILSFAACAGNEDMISLIIDAGASTRVQDYRGVYLIFH